ncbi:Homocysteine S-methyltransferase [Glarea lozoyensis ATCC 20868]|uniref:Homocysteine S-methyltransferase n=1 Tax=Glarea lozoyensis (strain ATCC 20868 / MF5171) TaxID=1116229 RepID=S3DRJ3_GLAL2|nr:Homocysteine S-methyltransferase [Glarea lozoyensis ATCC 20868]EPE29093.1 Homocysteine S-methyltransferase [Glarea lozoyensis ATCC 20868]
MSPPNIRLMDGGLGTLLTSPPHNITFTHDHPLWSSHLLTSKEGEKELARAQRSFVDAGADILLSATYQASFEGFGGTKVRYGRQEEGIGEGVGEEEAGRCMRRGVGVARECFDGGKGTVVLGLGAYGAIMIPGAEYSGVYDEGHRSVEELREWHGYRMNAFKSEKDCWREVDMVAFETIPVRKEVEAVREVMAGVNERDGRRFWISCVFPGEGNVLPDGSSVGEVVEAMLGKRSEGADDTPYAIGINCTKVGKVESLILEFEEAVEGLLESHATALSRVPALVLYPDGTMGEVYNTTTKVWEKKEDTTGPWHETIFEIVKRTRERNKWQEILLGGCCKTTPSDIAKLRKRIDELQG